MISAFFADDHSGFHAALLVAHGLASVDRAVAVVRPERHRRLEVTVLHIPRAESGDQQGGGLLDRLAAEAGAGRDVALVLPLAALADRAVRARADVCVIASGVTYFGAAAACAAAARLDGSHQNGKASGPVWLLPCSSLPGLRLPALPPGRTLPLTAPRLDHPDVSALIAGRADTELVRHGVALAALLEAAAADPSAAMVRPCDMAGMIASNGTDQGRQLSARLSALARRYAGLHDATPDPVPIFRPDIPVGARLPARRRLCRSALSPAPLRGDASDYVWTRARVVRPLAR